MARNSRRSTRVRSGTALGVALAAALGITALAVAGAAQGTATQAHGPVDAGALGSPTSAASAAPQLALMGTVPI